MIIFLAFCAIVGLVYIGLVGRYYLYWTQIPVPENQNTPVAYPPVQVTVIVPARNEERYIGPCLEALLAQDYPAGSYEIIVVDDFSTDRTAGIVEDYASPIIRLIRLCDYVDAPLNSYKKKAIEIGIVQATGELIITTDADCTMRPYWLKTMVHLYISRQAVFIAAPVKIHVEANIPFGRKFIQVFQSLDFMMLQGITGAAVDRGMHSMCNGANLSYSKATFMDVRGFEGIDAIASGDDMLLMHKISLKAPQKIFYLKSPAAIVETAAVNSWKAFLHQRVRWASKADKYSDKSLLPVLMLVYGFNVLLLVLPLMALFVHHGYRIGGAPVSIVGVWLVLLLMKMGVEAIFLIAVASFFRSSKLMWWFPFLQPFHILYTIIAGGLGKFGTYEWKGRTVQ